MIYILIALQLLDIASTIIALRGGAREANPVMKKVMDAIGIVPALVVVKGIAIALLLAFQDQLPQWFFVVACLGYVWIVYNNILVIRKNP